MTIESGSRSDGMQHPKIALCLALLATSPVLGQGWTRWGQNGHDYMAVARPNGITWPEARAEALAMGADLATIDSFAENDFVFGLAQDPSLWRTAQSPLRRLGPWLGGAQPPGTAVPSASWAWVTGEAWDYTNWSGGEPNDWQGVEEDRLQFFMLGANPGPRWNDLRQGAAMLGYVVERVPAAIGSSYCGPAIANSTGQSAVLTAYGSVSASDNEVVLAATRLPDQSAGYFLNGTAPASVLGPGGSAGRLCVGGAVGRYNGALEVQNTYARGYFGIEISLAATPTPLGLVSIGPGQTWYFQAWYRDTTPAGQATSNFTDAVAIAFQ